MPHKWLEENAFYQQPINQTIKTNLDGVIISSKQYNIQLVRNRVHKWYLPILKCESSVTIQIQVRQHSCAIIGIHCIEHFLFMASCMLCTYLLSVVVLTSA